MPTFNQLVKTREKREYQVPRRRLQNVSILTLSLQPTIAPRKKEAFV